MNIQLFHIQKISIDNLESTIENIRKNIYKQKHTHIILLDAHLFIKAKFNPQLKTVINEADLIIPTGKLLIWAIKTLFPDLIKKNTQATHNPTKHFKTPTPTHNLKSSTYTQLSQQMHNLYEFPEELTHSTPLIENRHFTLTLLQKLSKETISFFFLGGKQQHIKRAQKAIAQAFPKITILGFHSKELLQKRESALLEKLRKTQPNIVILDIEHGAQELWIAKKQNKLPYSFYIAQEEFIERFYGKREWQSFYKRFIHIKTWKKLLFESMFICFIGMHKIFLRRITLTKQTENLNTKTHIIDTKK